jgi:hypothetical protein
LVCVVGSYQRQEPERQVERDRSAVLAGEVFGDGDRRGELTALQGAF